MLKKLERFISMQNILIKKELAGFNSIYNVTDNIVRSSRKCVLGLKLGKSGFRGDLSDREAWRLEADLVPGCNTG